MRKALLVFVFGLVVAGTALAGGGDFNDIPQQHAAPETKIILVPNNGGNSYTWVAPVAVSVVTAVGVIIAAIVRRKGD